MKNTNFREAGQVRVGLVTLGFLLIRLPALNTNTRLLDEGKVKEIDKLPTYFLNDLDLFIHVSSP